MHCCVINSGTTDQLFSIPIIKMAERDIKLDIKRQERQIQRTKNNINILDDEIFEPKVNHIIFEIEGDFQLPPRYRS